LAVGQFDDIAYLPLPIYHFIESLQILLIVLKFVFPESMGRWYLVLMFYIALSLFLMFIAFLLAIVFVVSFFAMLFGVDYFTY